MFISLKYQKCLEKLEKKKKTFIKCVENYYRTRHNQCGVVSGETELFSAFEAKEIQIATIWLSG